MAKYYNSFWNYVDCGRIAPKEAVRDWKGLAINLATSFEYEPAKHNKQDMLDLLDECERENMQVVVCDRRLDFRRVAQVGKEQFEKDAQDAVADFGAHPATFGFHVGDEPSPADMDDMIFAYKTVKKYAPHLKHYVNLLPLWREEGFEKMFGFKPSEYGKYLDKIVKEAGLDILSYDCYAQCAYFEKEKHINVYLENLKVFGEVARANNILFFTSLLSVGHWSLRCPTQDDFKWQFSTAAAMGCQGFVWFFLYERYLDGSFRRPPIDLFWEKTETYTWLSKESRIFMNWIAPELEGYEWSDVRCYNVDVPFIEKWQPGDFGIKKLSEVVHESAPLLIAKFEGKEYNKVMVVNMDQHLPTDVVYEYSLMGKERHYGQWASPGQLFNVKLDK